MVLAKRRHILLIALICFFITCAWPAPAPALDAPAPPGTYVTDQTNTLSSSDLASLEKLLSEFERETSNQVVVLMIPSLEGDSLEDFSIRVAERWKPGQKGKDNGVLLLVAMKERKIRIEVGYGLEGALTDALADSIIRNEIAPQFKKSNYPAGIRAGLLAIIQATKGEYKGATGKDFLETVKVMGLLIAFLMIGIAAVGNFFRKGVTYDSNGDTVGGNSSGGSSFWGGGGGFSGGGGSCGGGGSSGGW